MKKIIFSLMFSIISLVVMSQTYNLNISGTITDDVTGDPVIQQCVDITIPGDSVTRDFFYFNRVFTDGNGYFEDNIDVPNGEEGEVFVSTTSCDICYTNSHDFSENNNTIVIDFSICNDPAGGGDCEAWFDYYHDGPDPLSVVFLDYSFGNPETWSWDFGDGTTSTEQNPIHLFDDVGEYYVSLEITADGGDCSSIFEMPVWVGNDTIWPGDCMAMYYYFSDSADYLTVDFIDMSIGRYEGPPDTWFWEFGDGTSSTEQNPSHTFGDYGDYNVCLTITSIDPASGDTCESTFCEDVSVLDWDNYCEAWFYYMPQGDSIPFPDGMTIQFMDESWGYPTSWLWDFGDGATSTEQNPIHEYADEGIYEVCLSISSDSCESTYCEDVFVYNYGWDDCFAWFEYEIVDLTVDYTAFYQGTDSSSTTATFTWDFGDGETGTGETIQHVYAEEGYYEVMLTAVADDGSCEVSYFDYVWIGDEFTFPVNGYVFLDNNAIADFADVYLMTFDTLGSGLINIATTQINANGYYEFEEVGFENCMYFVQAELTDASAFYGDYSPTYHYNALNWEEAWPVFPFPTGEGNDIFMIADSNVTLGDGNINGIVNGDENRSLMSNVLVLLQDENGVILTYIRTNENGEFQFPELNYGTYVVYTEIVGIETIPAIVTISQDNPTVDITIIVANGEAVMGVENISAYIKEVGNISPNPVSENARLEVSLKEDSEINIHITNQYGQIVSTYENHLNTGKNEVLLQTSSLSPGVYIVNILAEDGINTTRKFVKLR